VCVIYLSIKVHVLDKFIQWAFFAVHQRAYYFFPATYALVKNVIAQPIPNAAKVATCYAAVAMTLFNLIVLLACTDALRLALMGDKGSANAPTDTDCSHSHLRPRFSRRSSSIAASTMATIFLQLRSMDLGSTARTAVLAHKWVAKVKVKQNPVKEA